MLAALLASLLMSLLSAGAEGSAERFTLKADARERGWIGLTLHSPAGMAVTIHELGGSRIAELTPSSSRSHLRRAARWRCDRRVRRFVATGADGQTASTRVRTPSCARRLALVLPARAAPGAGVKMRLVDRWSLGDFVARVCVEPPGGPERCRSIRVRAGQRSVTSSFVALRPGGWRVSARTGWDRAARGVRVAPPGGSLSVLATGDSMMQRLDGFLAGRLRARGARMRSDAYEATGISKPGGLDWAAHAHRQAGSRPDVVVMFIGANDAFPMGGASCCGRTWVAEYARRARSMMLAYARGGRTRVLWLLLPTPRDGFVRRSFPAVNTALRRAAAPLRRDVRIVDLVKVFSPGGRYRKWIRVGEGEVGVRQADGIHLSDEGAAIAANVVMRTLRDERILS